MRCEDHHYIDEEESVQAERCIRKHLEGTLPKPAFLSCVPKAKEKPSVTIYLVANIAIIDIIATRVHIAVLSCV